MKTITLLIIMIVVGWFSYNRYFKETGVEAEPGPVAEAPAPSRGEPVTAEKDKVHVESLLGHSQYAEARRALEAVPEKDRAQKWKRQMAEALDGLGEREAALAIVNEIISVAAEPEQAELQLFKAQVFLNDGKRQAAEDELYQIFLRGKGSKEAGRAAGQLQKLWSGRDLAEAKPGDLTRMNLVLTHVLDTAIDEDMQSQAVSELDRVNAQLFFSHRKIPGIVAFHAVKYGETISGIAKKYKVYPDRIIRANNMNREVILRADQSLRIIQGPMRIIVRLDEFTLNLYLGDMFFKRYRVGIGRDNKTPITQTRISKSLAHHPSYRHPDTMELIPNSDPRNPIGPRWIGLEMGQGYGIHGTRDPESIGKESSNGCIRMLNEDVEELFDYVMSGDEVVFK